MNGIDDLPLYMNSSLVLDTPADVTAAGWPYHGIAIRREATRNSLTSLQFIMPDWPSLDGSYPVIRSVVEGSADVLPVKVQNQEAPWDYFFLSNGWVTGWSILDPESGADQYVRISEGYAAKIGDWHIGVPLRTPSDRFLNINAWAQGNTIYISSMPTYAYPGIVGIDSAKHPLGKFEMTHDFVGAASHYRRPVFAGVGGSWFTDNPDNISCYAKILDYFNNKLLIGVFATASPAQFYVQEVDRDGLDYARDYRYRQMGNSVIRSNEQSEQIICIYEYVLNGETAKDATVTLIASPQDCEGNASRTSPAESTVEPDPANPAIGATRRVYQHSVSQYGAVLSAYYEADGAIKFVHYDAEHSCQLTHDGFYKGMHRTQEAIFESKLSVAGVTKHIKQEITHEFDYANMPPDWNTNVEYIGNPWIIVKNKIFDNGVLVVDESIAGHDHDLFIAPVSINNLSGGRAPFIGYESRAVIGVAYNYASVDEFFNMSQYSITLRDNGSGTYVLYSVIDNFAYNNRLPNNKRVSDCHVISRFGNSVIPAFEDTVVYRDDRYARQDGATPINFTEFAILKGYMGAKLKGAVNPVTGALYIEHVDRPLDTNRWM